ncbi:hypothetical protein [Nonomuraea harbinensis]|uniref:Uncharacterized protein n=1 Tax=Nonomuraea harbinensis TaxID=1286938 RepID=A0ABW1C1R9_9ACTN|nr:hypothetical protein [Nonomuraea harbinensis]
MIASKYASVVTTKTPWARTRSASRREAGSPGARSVHTWARPSAPASSAIPTSAAVIAWATTRSPASCAASVRAVATSGVIAGRSAPCTLPAWVGCPPGAVARVPALRRSATSSFPAASRRCSERISGRQNMSSSVVTPCRRAWARLPSNTCVCASISPGRSVLPAPPTSTSAW